MPILGVYGNSSDYAYRGFIVDLPDPFDWIDLYLVEPGQEYRSGYAKITGIKSPLPLRVSVGSSFSLVSNVFDNGQTVSFDNGDVNQASFDEYSDPNNRFQPGLGFDETNAFVSNNQSINLAINAPKVLKTDFSKTYTTNVSVGRSDQDWIVQTRAIDETPGLFSFIGIGSTTTRTLLESNEIVISGLETGFSFPSQVISGVGTISVNGTDRGSSFDVFNGDTIKLKTTSSNLFDTATNIEFQVGTYSTTWSVSTEIENLDITFTPTDFTNQSNLQLNTAYNSNQITLTGFSLNSALPVTLSNTNAAYEIERDAAILKSFDSISDTPVINNDKIRVRLTSSASYSTSVSTNFTVGNTSADWTITTRSAPPVQPPVQPPQQPPTTTYNVQRVFRYRNGNGSRHFCSTATAVGGFVREGQLCSTFTRQAPGSGGIVFGFNGSIINCGFAYFSSRANTTPIYSLINSSIGDELWSTSPSEGTGIGYVFNRTVFYAPTRSLTV